MRVTFKEGTNSYTGWDELQDFSWALESIISCAEVSKNKGEHFCKNYSKRLFYLILYRSIKGLYSKYNYLWN